MSRICAFTMSVFVFGLCCSFTAAQEQPAFPKPEKEHQWLNKFVGEWSTTSKCVMPGQPSFVCSGTIKSHMLGGFWVINEMNSDIMGTPMRAVQTVGYDPAKKKYIGSWVDSMMNHMWRYEGTVDKDGKKLTLEAEGPNMMAGGKRAKFRDAYEFTSADHILVTSSMLGEDGKWITFMSGEAQRKDRGNK